MFNYIVKPVKLKAVNTIKAMSLIEIIVAISIVFVLSAMSLYSYQEYNVKAQINSALSTVEQNKLAISSYYSENKSCPANTFISQQLNNANCTVTTATPCAALIDNTSSNSSSCTLNLKNANGQIILYFQPLLTSLGDLQYFCVPGNPAPANKYLSITCSGLPPNYLSNGYTNP